MENIHRKQIDRRLMIRLRESLIDLDLCVDNARVTVDRDVDVLRRFVARRDAVAQKLSALVESATA